MAPLKNISGKFSSIKVGRSGREMRSMLLDHISHNLFTNLSLPSYNLLDALLYLSLPVSCYVPISYGVLILLFAIAYWHCYLYLSLFWFFVITYNSFTNLSLTTTCLMLFAFCLCLCCAICLPALLSLCDFVPLPVCIDKVFNTLYFLQLVYQNCLYLPTISWTLFCMSLPVLCYLPISYGVLISLFAIAYWYCYLYLSLFWFFVIT